MAECAVVNIFLTKHSFCLCTVSAHPVMLRLTGWCKQRRVVVQTWTDQWEMTACGEWWIMRRTESPIVIRSFIFTSSWPHYTLWWLLPTGTSKWVVECCSALGLEGNFPSVISSIRKLRYCNFDDLKKNVKNHQMVGKVPGVYMAVWDKCVISLNRVMWLISHVISMKKRISMSKSLGNLVWPWNNEKAVIPMVCRHCDFHPTQTWNH